VKRAAIPGRWGYASDMRTALLTRSVPRPTGSLHQGSYYQYLTRALGMKNGPLEPMLTVPAEATETAHRRLRDAGWDGIRPLVVFAPGAAYGTAKRSMPEYVARVATELVRQRQATCVLVGSAGDSATTRDVRTMVDPDATRHVIDLSGQTTIEVLAGVLGSACACVANDSGAMHLAAAVGTRLVAIFGPTREYETAPLTRSGRPAEVLTHPVSCRPCMLRECPIDHRCMKRITPERVYTSLVSLLSSTP
jgi:heptosyltransferase-2